MAHTASGWSRRGGTHWPQDKMTGRALRRHLGFQAPSSQVCRALCPADVRRGGRQLSHRAGGAWLSGESTSSEITGLLACLRVRENGRGRGLRRNPERGRHSEDAWGLGGCRHAMRLCAHVAGRAACRSRAGLRGRWGWGAAKRTFLQPAISCRRSLRKDGFDINPDGTVNAVLSPNDAEAQALWRGEER